MQHIDARDPEDQRHAGDDEQGDDPSRSWRLIPHDAPYGKSDAASGCMSAPRSRSPRDLLFVGVVHEMWENPLGRDVLRSEVADIEPN